MTIIDDIKFLLSRYIILNCCVVLPFIVFLGQVSHFLVEQESAKYVGIIHDIQAVVAFIMFLAGLLIKDVNYNPFN